MTTERFLLTDEILAWCLDYLPTCASTLNSMMPKVDAEKLYNVSADGLEWSDEYPAALGRANGAFNRFFTAALNLRTSAILGIESQIEFSNRLRASVAEVAPDWAWVLRERFSANYKPEFEELKTQAFKRLDGIG